MYVVQSQFWSDLRKEEVDRNIMCALVTCENDNKYERILNCIVILFPEI